DLDHLGRLSRSTGSPAERPGSFVWACSLRADRAFTALRPAERARGAHMNLQQALAFGLVVVTIAVFVWGRFRYDLVALAALLAGVVLGIIPPQDAFEGFSNDITVIIACALVVSAGFARSGLIERVLRPVLPRLTDARSQVPVLVGAVALLSMATKNVGALAIM